MSPESAQPRLFAFARNWRHWLARLEQWPAWRLFLGALLLGLLVSLPWQCAKQFRTKQPLVVPTVTDIDDAQGAQAPSARTGRAASILGMPAPSVAPVVEEPITEVSGAETSSDIPVAEPESAPGASPAIGEASAAVAVFSPPPRYPSVALNSGEQGTVLVRVDIDSTGMPTDMEIEQSSRSRALDRAALDALRQWRFRPAFAQGVAVESSLVIPISFKSGSDN